MQGFTPCLWFDGEAEEAARFYTSVFPASEIERVTRYEEAGAKASGRPAGSVMTVEFRLDGRPFLALNGGPELQFTPAISLMVDCDTQEEIDHFWERLSEGGEPGQCGWLQDRFGVSWQIVPAVLNRLLEDADPTRSTRVVRALLTMTKLDIEALERAAAGG